VSSHGTRLKDPGGRETPVTTPIGKNYLADGKEGINAALQNAKNRQEMPGIVKEFQTWLV
jgi:hypothetical protein